MRSTGLLDGSFGPTGGWADVCASSNDRGHSEDVLSPWLQRESKTRTWKTHGRITIRAVMSYHSIVVAQPENMDTIPTMAVADDTFTIKIGIKNPVYAIISKCDEELITARLRSVFNSTSIWALCLCRSVVMGPRPDDVRDWVIDRIESEQT
jgi:hypothetical protein